MTQSDRAIRIDDGSNIWTSYKTRDRTLLTIGCVASYCVFYSVAELLNIPGYLHHQPSLVAQSAMLAAFVMTIVLLLACTAVTTLFTGIIEYEAGLFCGCVGMLALSVRGGPMHELLMYHPGNGIFFKLLIETAVLAIFIVVAWKLLDGLRFNGLLRPERELDLEFQSSAPFPHLLGLAVQVVIMIFLMAMLAQTDKKAQVDWSIIISALVAALIANHLFPAQPSIWYWPTPLIVGAIGYLAAGLTSSTSPGGAVGGILPALARPLPLDYASVGVAASLMGYWWGRHWHLIDNEAAQSP